METLVHHIETLLQQHDFVIVPDWGGFVASHEPAYEENGLLYPPCKAIGFNPQLRYNDGLLAHAYVQSHGISFEQASELIRQEVLLLQANLKHWKHLSFGRLGYFYQEGGTCRFSPQRDYALTDDAFGLVPFYFPEIHTALPAAASAQVQPSPVVRVDLRPRQFSQLAMVAAVALLFVLLFPTHTESPAYHQQASLVWSQPQPAEMATETDSEDVEGVEECTPYHIIIASFATQTKAREFLSSLPKELNDAYLLYSEQRFRIAHASYGSQAACETALQDFVRRYPRYSDAWILYYNP